VEKWGQIIGVTSVYCRFRIRSTVSNQDRLIATGVINRCQISYFLTRVKLIGGAGKMCEWISRVQPMTKPIIFFGLGAARMSDRSEIQCPNVRTPAFYRKAFDIHRAAWLYYLF